jgi:hypothetical protein
MVAEFQALPALEFLRALQTSGVAATAAIRTHSQGSFPQS